jgi:hypothetical protein
MSGKRGFYSDVIVYDERNRYYYLWAQKNKPLLDDEIRNMGIGLLDQVRRGIQNVYGEIASPNNKFSGYFSTAEAFKVKEGGSIFGTQENFTVTGGVSLDRPAVLYAKGFYIFLTGDIEYRDQTYPSDNIDLNTEADKSRTLTPIPMISQPDTDRIDIVYVSLHFAEVTAVTGTDQDVYRDSNLKNPIVGTETANRLRAVIDIKVLEGWSGSISKNIFNESQGSVSFIGAVSSDGQPTDNAYNIPIAAIYRTAYSDTIVDSQIVDLLSLYNKRVCSLDEISYRITHGGYSTDNISDQGLSGFTPQFANGIIDEGAFATGLNQGLNTEAFNSNSVTPRVLNNDGKFLVNGLMVGHDTGLVTLETGPEALNSGELIAKQISARQVMIGFGETGITGIRGYSDTLSVIHRGETGKNIVSITNLDGETGSLILLAKAIQNGDIKNFVAIDYEGRVGINTQTPGQVQPDPIWNTNRYNDGLQGATGVNTALEVNGSAQVNDHLLVGKDAYIERDMYGRTWKLPGSVSRETPMLIGFTGIPQSTDVVDAASIVLIKRGVAVVGETGISAYGYTGGQVAYEAYDADGIRLFTIGDIGNEFDRSVMSLYGMSTTPAFLSDSSLLVLPAPIGTIAEGDIIEYNFRLEDGGHVTGMYEIPLGSGGWAGITGLVGDILNNVGFPADPNQGYTGMPYTRLYTYLYNSTDDTVTSETGMAYGVQVVEDSFGYTGMGMDQHGRIIIKDLLVGADPIKVEAVELFRVTRGSFAPVNVTFTEYHYFGSGGYGGNLLNVKFAKLDLGEAADGWLFNGDVYFNGIGLLNRVTFSPNVIFRDDIFVYGTIYANEQIFNIANVQNLTVKNNIWCGKKGYFKEGASFGDGADVVYESLRQSDSTLNLYVKGNGMADKMTLRGTDVGSYLMGTLDIVNIKDSKVSANIGGTQGSTSNPFGIHLIDSRNVTDTNKLKTLTIDFSDGKGNYYSDGALEVKGNVSTNGILETQYLGVGPIEEVNTNYRLQVQGRALINDILEVKALRFIGAEAPEGNQDITDPSNISVVADGKETYQNNTIILREKKFTSTKRIYLNNGSGLGYDPFIDYGETGPQYYYEGSIQAYYDAPSTSKGARWAFDNVSYLEDQFNEIGASSDTIVVENITIEKYKKYRCERIRLASLGTLTIQWSGYIYDPGTSPTVNSVIQQYSFTSSFFRNRDNGITVDWFPENDRFGDDNFVIKVSGTFTDSDPGTPTIFTFIKPLCIYIKKSDWWQYYKRDTADANYTSFAIFYPYEHITKTMNIYDVVSVSSYSGAYSDPGWKLAIYPRLVEQRRVVVGNNNDKLYEGDWSMDLCLISEQTGRIANLVGDLQISYFQS